MKEFRQVSAFGGMAEVKPCHHDSPVEGCEGCCGPAYVLASDVTALVDTIEWANRNGLLTWGGQPRGRVSAAIAAVIKESLDRINQRFTNDAGAKCKYCYGTGEYLNDPLGCICGKRAQSDAAGEQK